MKRINILFLLFLCTFGYITAQNKAQETRTKLLSRDYSSVLVAAHRGDWRYAPENSLPAIDNAINMGVDIVEIDVQRTRDGHIILMHDKTLDRTTTGSGLVSEWMLDSIRTLKLRNGCAIQTKEVVPTLEEALCHAKGKIMLNLDKADRYFDEIYPLLMKTGTVDQIIMKGWKDPQEVKQLYGKYLDNVIYMPIVDLDREDAKDRINMFINDMSPVAFEFLFKHDSNQLPKDVASLLNSKVLIWYNTLWDTMAGGHDDDMSLDNPDNGYGYLIDTLGCRIIQTDRPAYLIDYLQKRNLR